MVNEFLNDLFSKDSHYKHFHIKSNLKKIRQRADRFIGEPKKVFLDNFDYFEMIEMQTYNDSVWVDEFYETIGLSRRKNIKKTVNNLDQNTKSMAQLLDCYEESNDNYFLRQPSEIFYKGRVYSPTEKQLIRWEEDGGMDLNVKDSL